MPIEDDKQLLEVVAQVNMGIQEIQDYLGAKNRKDARVKFPTGFLRTCNDHRACYPFLQDYDLKSNIAYALMTTDVLRWLLNRTTIMGTAQQMLIKQGIAIIGGIIEAITKVYLKGYGSRRGYKTRSERLMKLGVIDDELRRGLDWVWQRRQNIHLHLIHGRDFQDYSLNDYNWCVRVLHSLRDSMAQHGPLPPK